jgi:hypothetical protein
MLMAYYVGKRLHNKNLTVRLLWSERQGISKQVIVICEQFNLTWGNEFVFTHFL